MKTLERKSFFMILGFGIFNALFSEHIYISQSGTGTGASCASSKSANWFNTLANWGTGANKISAGDTVHLCGSITANLSFRASGTTNNYITIDGTGATFSGAFNITTFSWWKIQNVTWAGGSTQVLVTICGSSNGVFEGNYADDVSGDPTVWLSQYNGTDLPNNITIRNNYIRTTTSNLGNVQLDIIKTEGSNNVMIEGNYLEMRAGGAGSNSHNDCIQTYEKGGSSGGPPSNWTIRHNKIVMNSSATNDRSWMMLESLKGTINIYGNIFLGIQGAESANGLAAGSNKSNMVLNIFNNTFVAKNNATNNVLNLASPGTSNLKNNIFYTNGQTAITGNMITYRDHNLWFGSNSPSCNGFTGEICGQNPKFTNYATNDFSLLGTSPAISAGSNLGITYSTSLLSIANWPNPTIGAQPVIGNWEMGAYQFGIVSAIPKNVNDDISVTVYPNPFYEMCHITIASAIILQDAKIQIYDVSGKRVKDQFIESRESLISKGGLQSGLYFYNISNNDKTISRGKLIIQ